MKARWLPSAVVTALPDGGTEVRLDVASEVEMRPWVLRWGPLVEVIDPQSLRDYVADAVRRAAELYAAQPAAETFRRTLPAGR